MRYKKTASLFVLLLLTGILVSCHFRPKDLMVKRSQLLMGTLVEITVVSDDETRANEAINAAFREIKRLEDIMSTYIPSSDISRVNAAAGLHPVKVHEDLIRAVKRGLEFTELSGGAFNIAMGPAIDLWNVTQSDRIPLQDELEQVRPLLDYRNVIINEQEKTIFLKKKGMKINLGGIGKGFAGDYACRVLKNFGIKGGIVAVAGDVRVFGRKPDGSVWTIGIKHPRNKDDIIAAIHLTDGAVSTSGDYERFFIKKGKRYHHIISPETLQPAQGFQSVSVIAKDAVTSDALSTAIFVLGPKRGKMLLKKHGNILAINVLSSGIIQKLSPGGKTGLDVKIEILK